MILSLLAGCADDRPAKPMPSRTQAVTVAQSTASLDGFCDARARTPYAWPELRQDAPKTEGWLWVNVWATWCGPCIEEMPLLQRWEKKLKGQGFDVDLVFLSADETVPPVTKFHKTHPDIRTGVQMADAEGLGDFLDGTGGSREAGLPAHIFVDREGRIDCVRAGSFHKGNFTDLTALLSQ